MLNTRDALKLHNLLESFIPEEDFGDDILGFIGTIVSDIRFSETPENLALAIMLMDDLTMDDIAVLSGKDAVAKFTEGLVRNKIVSLVEFFRWLT